MGKIEKTFWWLCFILAVYTTVGFKLIPTVLQDQLIKNLDENLTAKSTIEKVEFNPYSLTARVYNYKLVNEQTIASFDKLEIDLGLVRSITDLHANVQEVLLDNLYLNVIEQKDGTINLTKLVKPSTTPSEPTKEESSSDITFLVSKLILDNAKVDFTKEKENGVPYKISISDLDYKLRDFGTYENSLSSNDLKIVLNDKTKLSVEGAFRLIPFKMYGVSKIEDLRVKEILDYDMSKFNFSINKEANVNLDTYFNIDTTNQTDINLTSNDININNLNLSQNGVNVVSLKKLDVGVFSFNLLKQLISIENPTIDTLNSNIINGKNGLNVANFVKTSNEPNKVEKIEEPKAETTTESKPWIVKVTNSDLKNISAKYSDTINSLVISTQNNSSKLGSFNLNGSNIELTNLSLNAPLLSFEDTKNKLSIGSKDIDTKLSSIKIASGNIALNKLTLNSSNINFSDNKNSLNISTNAINTNMDKLNIANSKIAINSVKLNTGALNFKDKSSISIGTSKNSINANGININGSNIDIKSVNTTLNNLNFNELKSKLNIKSSQAKLDTSNLKIDGSKVNIGKIALNTPSLNLTDTINKMNVDVTSTNVDLESLALNGSNININSIKLSKPDITFTDRKNNISLKTNDLQVYLNKFSQKGSILNINSIRLVQPKLNFLDTKEKTKILANNIDLSVSNIYNSNNLFKISKTTLNRPEISVILPKSTSSKTEAKKTEKKTTSSSKNGKKIDVGPVTIRNAKLNFEDKNLPIPFKTTVSKLNGGINEFKSDKQSTTKLQVKGVVDDYGTTNITGVVNPNSIKILTDINMVFKNIAMENFTPYTGKFIGRELASGKLDLDLNYNIQSSNLKAQNNIVINQLKLGNKVESKDAVSLPLELAIALLEDSNGVIDLTLPVSGNVDDPQFSIAPIVFKAFVNLITKALTAPFSLLGAVFGFDANEINSVDFDYGQSEITPIQRETLDKINKILTKRPNLILNVIPSYENTKDLFAMKKEKFQKIIDNKLPNKDDKDYEEDYIDLIEDIYEDFDKDVDDVEDKYTKDRKFDVNAYKKEIEEFIINKQDVKTEDLEKLAKTRALNIKEYLVKQKGISVKQVEISKDLKAKTTTSKTSNIDLKIDKL